ncbi:MAG: GPW/gp25 family protein [Rhizobiaceae bacterium]|nr:GPW/gp25 family protein [Rhizobiaceae bacterium]
MFRFNLAGGPGARPGLTLDADGRVERVGGLDELHQSLLTLLATRPGERREHPDYGCALDRLAFEPNDGTTAGMAIRMIVNAVLRFEPRAEIVLIDAGPDPGEPDRMIVGMTYMDRRTGQTRDLHLPLGLREG